MSTRVELLDRVRITLAKAGFAVSERCDIRPISFDVVARRDRLLLILKVLGNVDAFSERVAHELTTLAKFLGGVPLLVGERSGAGLLESGVAYAHRGIPVLTIETLEEFFLASSPPLVHATPGGLHVRLDGDLLRRLRQERSLSLGLLAHVAGVSRRAIQMYEAGMRATVESALRLEEFLEESLVQPVDPFQLFVPEPEGQDDQKVHVSGLEAEVFRMLRSVGFRVVPTPQSPFEAVSQEAPKKAILTGVEGSADRQTARRAQLMSSIAAVTEKDGMIIVRQELSVTNMRGIPVVRRTELERIRDPAELADFLDERRKTKGIAKE